MVEILGDDEPLGYAYASSYFQLGSVFP